MSLEEKLAELTKAVEKNTEVQLKILESFKSGGAQAPSNKGTTAGKGANTGKGTTTKKDHPTETAMRDAFGGWMAERGIDAAEKDNRRNLSKKVAEHFGGDRITAIPEEKRQDALDVLEDLKNGKYPDFIEAPSDEEEDVI